MSKSQQQSIRRAIIKALAEQGMSQAELARRSGVPRTRINPYLRGHRDITSENADRLLEALGLKVSSAVSD